MRKEQLHEYLGGDNWQSQSGSFSLSCTTGNSRRRLCHGAWTERVGVMQATERATSRAMDRGRENSSGFSELCRLVSNATFLLSFHAQSSLWVDCQLFVSQPNSPHFGWRERTTKSTWERVLVCAGFRHQMTHVGQERQAIDTRLTACLLLL